jgi:hypothetical protein
MHSLIAGELRELLVPNGKMRKKTSLFFEKGIKHVSIFFLNTNNFRFQCIFFVITLY